MSFGVYQKNYEFFGVYQKNYEFLASIIVRRTTTTTKTTFICIWFFYTFPVGLIIKGQQIKYKFSGEMNKEC